MIEQRVMVIAHMLPVIDILSSPTPKACRRNIRRRLYPACCHTQGQLNATVIFIELEVDHAGSRVRP